MCIIFPSCVAQSDRAHIATGINSSGGDVRWRFNPVRRSNRNKTNNYGNNQDYYNRCARGRHSSVRTHHHGRGQRLLVRLVRVHQNRRFRVYRSGGEDAEVYRRILNIHHFRIHTLPSPVRDGYGWFHSGRRQTVAKAARQLTHTQSISNISGSIPGRPTKMAT